MVVMMNPGSSYPLDGVDNNCVASKAVPDRTQEQIMKVMNNCNYEYARILNLSDLRTPKSKYLYEFIKTGESNGLHHSIFCDERKTDLNSLLINNVPIIYGWGVNEALTDLAESAFNRINHPNPVGMKKAGTIYAYYHPLPQVHKKQIEWVKNITKMLQRT